VALVAVGAYGAGATNLFRIVLSGTGDVRVATVSPVAAPAHVETGPIKSAASPAVLNRAEKSDRLASRQGAAGGVIEAALFAPAVLSPQAAFLPTSPAPVPALTTGPAVANAAPVTTGGSAAQVANTSAVPTPKLSPGAPSAPTPTTAPTVLAYASAKDVGSAAPFNAIISDKPGTVILDPKIDANRIVSGQHCTDP